MAACARVLQNGGRLCAVFPAPRLLELCDAMRGARVEPKRVRLIVSRPESAPKLALVIAARIVLMPVIAGVSYEITVKWAGSHPENPLVKVVLWPGMQMQYLTTNEPDDEQLACAIAAMKPVLERERRVAEAAA